MQSKAIDVILNALQTPRIYAFGRIAELRKARKDHTCEHCRVAIGKGFQYYSVISGGGGLQSITWPDRVHIGCLEDYLKAIEAKAKGRD